MVADRRRRQGAASTASPIYRPRPRRSKNGGTVRPCPSESASPSSSSCWSPCSLFGAEAAARDRPLARHGHARVQGLGHGQGRRRRGPCSHRLSQELPPADEPAGRAAAAERASATRLLASAAHGPEASAASPAARRGGDARRAPRRAAHADPDRLPRRARRRLRRRLRLPRHADRLADAAAPGRQDSSITLGVDRAVHDLGQGLRSTPRSCSRCRCILWQLWAFLAPALEEQHPAHRRRLRRCSRPSSSSAASPSRYFVVLPRALTS